MAIICIFPAINLLRWNFSMDESALKALISLLGDHLSSLGLWMYAWTAFVIVGCAGELFFVIHAYLDERRLWLQARTRGSIAFPEKPSLRMLILEVTSVALVVAGIAGELYVDWRADDLQTRLRDANARLVALYNDKASAADERSKQLGKDTEALKTEGANAKRDMVAAQLELAKLTGPPYRVKVINGTATPDLSKSLTQLIVLTTDGVRIKAPILPSLQKGGILKWTLILDEDGVGSHPYTLELKGDTAPMPGLVPNSRTPMDFQTDSTGKTVLRSVPIVNMPIVNPK